MRGMPTLEEVRLVKVRLALRLNTHSSQTPEPGGFDALAVLHAPPRDLLLSTGLSSTFSSTTNG